MSQFPGDMSSVYLSGGTHKDYDPRFDQTPRSPAIGWGHDGPQPYFPQPQPRFNPYASQAPFNPYANKFMPLPGPRPGPMPPPRSPGKGRYGRSYRPPTFPSNYGQMRYTPQRFGGYGIPSSLPGILNRPIGPPPGGPGRKGGGSPGKGGRPGGPGRKGGGGQYNPYHQDDYLKGPGSYGTGQLPTGQLPGPTQPQPGGGGMIGTLGGPGYGEFPLGTAGPIGIWNFSRTRLISFSRTCHRHHPRYLYQVRQMP